MIGVFKGKKTTVRSVQGVEPEKATSKNKTVMPKGRIA
jgi:hypothetical protein